MKGHNGQIVFACGKKYTEVPQKAIGKVGIGMKMVVWNNESHPKELEGSLEISCLGCPCKRRAKREKDMFYHKNDIDPKTDEAIRTPTGICVQCAIVELVPDTKINLTGSGK